MFLMLVKPQYQHPQAYHFHHIADYRNLTRIIWSLVINFGTNISS